MKREDSPEGGKDDESEREWHGGCVLERKVGLNRFFCTAGPAAILTGPEGGFTDEERIAIRSAPNALPISLGPRILRAETAALAALTIYMALAGDWR